MVKNRLEHEIAKHAQSLEKAVEKAIGSRSRVRKAFKQVPVKPRAGIGEIVEQHTPTEAFQTTIRTQQTTSQVSKKTKAPIALTNLPDCATSFVDATLQDEDEHLFGELVGAGKSGRGQWDTDWPTTIRTHLAESAKLSSPQTLVAVKTHPDPNQVAVLKTLNVTVLPAPGSIVDNHDNVVGLLLNANSEGAVLRVEQDWQLQWERDGNKTDKVHLVMEAFWLPAVTKNTVQVFETRNSAC